LTQGQNQRLDPIEDWRRKILEALIPEELLQVIGETKTSIEIDILCGLSIGNERGWSIFASQGCSILAGQSGPYDNLLE
jgi:hypothetical protein